MEFKRGNIIMIYEISGSEEINYTNYDNYHTSGQPMASASEITPEEYETYSSKLEELKKDMGYLADACDALSEEITLLEKEKDALIQEGNLESKNLYEDFRNGPQTKENSQIFQTKLEELNAKYGQKLESLNTKINSKKEEFSILQKKHDSKQKEFKSTYTQFEYRMKGIALDDNGNPLDNSISRPPNMDHFRKG